MAKRYAVLRHLRQITTNPDNSKQYLNEYIAVLNVFDTYERAKSNKHLHISLDGEHHDGDDYYYFDVKEISDDEYTAFLEHRERQELYYITNKNELYDPAVKKPKTTEIETRKTNTPRDILKTKSSETILDEISVKFINELEDEIFDYERAVIRKYCRTGSYYPNQDLYEKVRDHVNRGMDEHKEMISYLESNRQWYSFEYPLRIWDRVWQALMVRKNKLEEYDLLSPSAKELFQSWDRHSLYQSNILRIDRSIKKFCRQARRLWRENEDYYRRLKMNYKI